MGFDQIQFELQKNLSNAYYETHESFEDVVEKLERLIKNRGINTLYTTTKIILKKNLSPWWSQEQIRNENRNQAKQRKKKENQNTTTAVNKKLIKDLEPKTESVLTYRGENKFLHTEKKTIKPEDRFEDKTFQNPTDWEAFDNLAKYHGIPTLADLKKGGNYSAYLVKTDYITEPEPHPYQEILEKENHSATNEKIFKAERIEKEEITKEKILEKGNHPATKEKMFKAEKIEKEKIPKVENMIPKKKIKEKVIAENVTSPNETKDSFNIEKDRDPGIWHRNKGDTRSPEQTQINTENSECKRCNKKFVSKQRMRFHETVCKENTTITIDSGNIKKTTKIKNTEDNIENETKYKKIEKKDNKEVITKKDNKKELEEEGELKIEKNTKIEEVKKVPVEEEIPEIKEILIEKEVIEIKLNKVPEILETKKIPIEKEVIEIKLNKVPEIKKEMYNEKENKKKRKNKFKQSPQKKKKKKKKS